MAALIPCLYDCTKSMCSGEKILSGSSKTIHTTKDIGEDLTVAHPRKPRQTHIVEFDYLTRDDMRRVLKWCRTCCFQPYTTQIQEGSYRFLFQSKADCQLFMLQHRWLFDIDNDIPGIDKLF